MSWLVVAKKDFRDSIQSRLLWALAGLFVLLMAGLAYVFTLLQDVGGGVGEGATALTTIGLVGYLVSPVSLIVPLAGLIIGHKSLIGEVESGTVKFLLAMPHTRRDAVLGKVLGRTAVLSVGLLIGIAIASIVVLALYDETNLLSLGTFTLFTLLFGMVYVGIGVAISAGASTGSRATAYAVGFFVFFEYLWGFIPAAILFLLEGSFFPEPVQRGGQLVMDAPGWYFFIQRLSPGGAYSATVTGFVEEANFSFAPVFDGGVPLYLTEWAALAILLVWLVVPALLGYLRFRAVDL